MGRTSTLEGVGDRTSTVGTVGGKEEMSAWMQAGEEVRMSTPVRVGDV